MIRYMSIMSDGKFNTKVANGLKSPVWNLDEKILEVPYIKLEIKIVGKEERYAYEGRPKKRRFLIFGKEK